VVVELDYRNLLSPLFSTGRTIMKDTLITLYCIVDGFLELQAVRKDAFLREG
jgi:hypothetical protein